MDKMNFLQLIQAQVFGSGPFLLLQGICAGCFLIISHPPSLVLGRSPGEGNGTPLWYSCLENPLDAEAWQATVHGVAKSQIRLSDFTFPCPKNTQLPFQNQPIPITQLSFGWIVSRMWCDKKFNGSASLKDQRFSGAFSTVLSKQFSKRIKETCKVMSSSLWSSPSSSPTPCVSSFLCSCPRRKCLFSQSTQICCYCYLVTKSYWTLCDPPHRLQPTRLLHPWDFPGKNIGVGCHYLPLRLFLTQGLNLHLCFGRWVFYH